MLVNYFSDITKLPKAHPEGERVLRQRSFSRKLTEMWGDQSPKYPVLGIGAAGALAHRS